MLNCMRLAVCLSLLLVFASYSIAQESKTYKDDKFGFSFTHTGLKESPYKMDVTVLSAYVDDKPGAFLEVEWLKPRKHEEYVKSMKEGMGFIDLEHESTKEVTISELKFTRIEYKNPEDGSKALHLIEKAEDDKWFYGITCIGGDSEEGYKTLEKAAESFSLDMKKVPAEPEDKHYVDRQFGFHVKLDEFKNDAEPWTEALLSLWTLYEDKNHLGTLIVRIVRRKGKTEQQMKDIRDFLAKVDRKIASEKEIEVDGMKSVRMKIEFDQRGVKNVQDRYLLYGDGVIWDVIAAYRPAESKGKESVLVDTLTSFKPPKREE